MSTTGKNCGRKKRPAFWKRGKRNLKLPPLVPRGMEGEGKGVN